MVVSARKVCVSGEVVGGTPVIECQANPQFASVERVAPGRLTGESPINPLKRFDGDEFSPSRGKKAVREEEEDFCPLWISSSSRHILKMTLRFARDRTIRIEVDGHLQPQIAGRVITRILTCFPRISAQRTKANTDGQFSRTEMSERWRQNKGVPTPGGSYTIKARVVRSESVQSVTHDLQWDLNGD